MSVSHPESPRRPSIDRRRKQAGFSLMELIIASVLAVIISAMMFSVLNEQEKTAAKTDVAGQLQDQLRFALQLMSRQIRMTGYGIGYQIAGSSYNGLATLQTCNNCGGYDADSSVDQSTADGTATDQLMIFYRNPSTEFELNADAYEVEPGDCSTTTLAVDRDIEIIGSLTSDAPTLYKDDVIVCFDESEPGGGKGLAWTVKENEVTIDQERSIQVYQNTEAPFTQICTSNIPYRMTCGSLRRSTLGFYLLNGTLWMDDDGDSLADHENFSLAQLDTSNTDDIPLARGIEDFQLAFCIPGYPDPSTTESDAEQSATNMQECLTNPGSDFWVDPNSVTLDLLPYLRAVRITLVARGPLDTTGKSYVSSRPQVEDHNPGDNAQSVLYSRLTQSIVVQLPNYRYLRGLAQEYSN